ncbi:DUF4232 domain-containing protein [Streptomyces sp. BK205]|uniref:DUF4232 domain-containing protein n=1 Tax=Streptomyces sp. BK205 TaxID=2512164 RepID=UPI00104DB57D|nr:DUF4232 domain-containing protein [Streptomyces sp. BK205]TCR23906.1 uncharacterized protein DUF4232 [Streptomyces sp. BK205]
MSNLRTSRTRLVAAAAGTVLAALALTACGDGTGTQDEGAATKSPSASASTDAGAKTPEGAPLTDSTAAAPTTASGAHQAASKTSTAGRTSSKGSSKGSSATATPVTCEGSNTKTVAAPLTRPVNHLLLTVTNTGSRTCFLYGYPAVRFGEAQSVPPVIEDSQPQAVVTLEPGQSGYASVNLSATDGSAAHGHTAKSLTVWFQGRSLSGSVGRSATPALPAKGVYVDDSLKVTYWQQDMDDAVSW